MHVYIIRHGETDANRAHVLQGRIDTPLNETGRNQARRAAEKLRGIHFDAIFSSPLCRARETAQIATGVDEKNFHLDPRIIEIGFGELEGAKVENLNGGDQYFLTAPEKYFPRTGGESFEELQKRINDFLEYLKTTEYENVLIASHGGAIRAIIMAMKNMKTEQFWDIDVINCAITEAELVEGRFVITKECDEVDPNYKL